MDAAETIKAIKSMKYLCLSIFLMVLSSCDVEHNKPLLLGNWKMVNWEIVPTQQTVEGRQMDFQFNDDDTYSVDYGGEIEEGTWRVAGNNLYTTENGMSEKMVKIVLINQDSLKFEMNRSGQLELVTLVKP